MMLTQWYSDLSVHIPEIDKQHQTLINAMQTLSSAIEEGEDQAVLKKTLDDLVDYVIFHFAAEEHLFDQYDYPDREPHRQQHREFAEKVFSFKSKHDTGTGSISQHLVDFLSTWVLEHIKYWDKKYGVFFSATGVTRAQSVTS